MLINKLFRCGLGCRHSVIQRLMTSLEHLLIIFPALNSSVGQPHLHNSSFRIVRNTAADPGLTPSYPSTQRKSKHLGLACLGQVCAAR